MTDTLRGFAALSGLHPAPDTTPRAAPTEAQRADAARELIANPALIKQLRAANIDLDGFALHGETARAAAANERAHARSKLGPIPIPSAAPAPATTTADDLARRERFAELRRRGL